MKHGVPLLLSLLAFAGCARPAVQTVAPASEIYLETALVDVVRSLAAARRVALEERSRPNGTPIGFDPCSVQVVFNVKATGSQTNTGETKLTLEAPVFNTAKLGVSTGASQTNVATGERGNTVTLLLTSPACVPAGSLGASHPKDIAAAGDQIAGARRDNRRFWNLIR